MPNQEQEALHLQQVMQEIEAHEKLTLEATLAGLRGRRARILAENGISEVRAGLIKDDTLQQAIDKPLFTRSSIRCLSGVYVDVLNPEPGMFLIEDIAQGLSMQCRFAGHLHYFYSVAQHSVRCSYLVPKEYALDALLHDASESYLVDIPRPIKQHLSNYKEIEDKVMEAIAKRFQIAWPVHHYVKVADEQELWREWHEYKLVEAEITVKPVGPEEARAQFLERFTELTKNP